MREATATCSSMPVLWLKSTGKAVESKPPLSQAVPDGPGVLRTKGAVAAHFGVHKRTVGEWLDVPSFPGKSGGPGKSNGRFPVEAIEAWLVSEGRTSSARPIGAQEGPHRDLLVVKVKRAQLELAREMNEVVSVAGVERFISRVVTGAASKLEEIPDRVDAVVADVMDSDQRLRIRKMIVDVVDGVRTEIAELVTGDEDNEVE